MHVPTPSFASRAVLGGEGVTTSASLDERVCDRHPLSHRQTPHLCGANWCSGNMGKTLSLTVHSLGMCSVMTEHTHNRVSISSSLSLQVLYHHISVVERQPLTTRGYPMLLLCKTFQQLYFIIPRESDLLDIMETINMFAQPSESWSVCMHQALDLVANSSLSSTTELYSELYAFQYRPDSSAVKQSSGWMMFDAVAEYERMGVPNAHWQATKLNRNYEVSCPNTCGWLSGGNGLTLFSPLSAV